MIAFRAFVMVMTCLVPSVCFAFQASEPAVGMVLWAEGAGEVERNDVRSPLLLGDVLFAGDRLIIGSGTATLLFCPTAERIELGAETVTDLNVDSFSVVEGPPATSSEANNCQLPQVALGAESLERVGALRARGFPPIPIYMGGKILDTRPAFEWAAVENVDLFRLTLTDAEGRTIWEHETSELRAVYPTTNEPLSEGAYRWELLGLEGGETTASQAANFRVEPEAGVYPESAEDDAGRMMRAVALENAGYYAEAAAEFRGVLAGGSTDERIVGHLAWLYWNAGLIAASNEEMERFNESR